MSRTQSDLPQARRSRFFVALLPPPDIQAYATELKTYFRDRYNSGAALRSPPHITLQPPFEWPSEQQRVLIQGLSDFAQQQAAVPLTLSGFGAFPPRVIYINVKPTPVLMALQANLSTYLEQQLAIAVPASRRRPFHPHLTLAFRDLKPKAFRQAWPEFETRPLELTCQIAQITLLMHTGQQWEAHQHFPLH